MKKVATKGDAKDFIINFVDVFNSLPLGDKVSDSRKDLRAYSMEKAVYLTFPK